MSKNICAAFWVLLGIGIANNAHATVVTVEATGQLGYASESGGAPFSIGDEFVFSYTYDTDSPDTQYSGAPVASYAASDLSVTFPSYFASSTSGSINIIQGSTDTYQITAAAPNHPVVGDDVAGKPLTNFQINFTGDAPDGLTSPPDLNEMLGTFSMTFWLGPAYPDEPSLQVSGSVSSITSSVTVPGPSSFFVFLAGLLVIGRFSIFDFRRRMLRSVG